jgi:hypothetical protein
MRAHDAWLDAGLRGILNHGYHIFRTHDSWGSDVCPDSRIADVAGLVRPKGRPLAGNPIVASQRVRFGSSLDRICHSGPNRHHLVHPDTLVGMSALCAFPSSTRRRVPRRLPASGILRVCALRWTRAVDLVFQLAWRTVIMNSSQHSQSVRFRGSRGVS